MYRVDTRTEGARTTVTFQGLLDRDALEALDALIERHRHSPGAIVVVLAAGTTVEAAHLDRLLAHTDITIEAESAFLGHWLRSRPSPEGAPDPSHHSEAPPHEPTTTH